MTFAVDRPAGLEDVIWGAVQAHLDRLERARRDNDLELMIGSSKELVETITKIVLESVGEVVASNTELSGLLTKAHRALDRLPSHGAAAEPPLRTIAQGAKTIITQLPELRNRLGTGHGRVIRPEVDDEDALLCIDATMLWSRWALRRLAQLLAGLPQTLVATLHGSGVFFKGDLESWLSSNLLQLEPADQRLVGVAIGQRAMRETFNVMYEGVEACAQTPDLAVWPAPYRAGLTEGLFLTRDGYVDVNEWGARASARIIAAHPGAAEVLHDLYTKITQASFAYRFDHVQNDTVARAMSDVANILPEGAVREAWDQIREHVDLD